MAKATLGHQGDRLSPRNRQRMLNWLLIEQEVEMAAARSTYSILLDKIPEEISSLMPQNLKGLRIRNQRKLSTKPSWLTKSILVCATFCTHAYKYNILPSEITQQTKYSKFKTDLKTHFLDKY